MLPKNERVERHDNAHWRMWLYGTSYSGKTYLANQFPNVLMLNSDGNVTEIDAPVVRIANQYTKEGLVMKTKLAWEVFKETIEDLKAGSEFETIVIDLVEDFYEYCRYYMYDKLHIEHESDDSLKAWDKIRTEFFSTIRNLLALPYNFILISQEDKSRDITAKGGEKVTTIKPNINDKVAIKLAGMVTLTARVINDHGNRTISFKTSDSIFGGSRIKIDDSEIACSYEEIIKILEGEHEVVKEMPKPKTTLKNKTEPKPEPKPEVTTTEKSVQFEVPIDDEDVFVDDTVIVEEEVAPWEEAVQKPVAETPEAPKRRRRRSIE